MQYGTIIATHMQIEMISVKAKPEIHKPNYNDKTKKVNKQKGDSDAA